MALRHLSTLDGVIGLKHAPGGIDGDTVALLADLPRHFSVLCGDDVLLSPMLALGAQGGILASAHVSTLDYVELAGAWQAGDIRQARELGHRLAGLSAALFAGPNPTVLKGSCTPRAASLPPPFACLCSRPGSAR
jgi:4-hydroxy-tetrahydrodipicolinate synthase